MIFSEPRDPRLITIRRGGSLTDDHHHLLALWAATCAEHVLHLFEEAQPSDSRPRHAIEQARAWTRGEITMSQSRAAAGHAMAAARSAAGSATSSPMQFANLCVMINYDAMTCAGQYLLVNQPGFTQNASPTWPHGCTDTGATGESASICSWRYRSQKKLDKEKDSIPPKGNGDVDEDTSLYDA